ncbi:MAG: heme lyase CcmF/NrfE family subunit [bacterium]|nr:heme lyase CcmF/NrfE family subunit [bacterium]MDT8366553.1 heme lyase CcmF/NrfE family subunit [bacterium]
MNAVGDAALIVAFFVSLYGTGAALAGALAGNGGGVLAGRRNLIKSSRLAVYLTFGLLTIASAALLKAFLARDFSLLYVFEYSNRSLSDAYAVTAFWAGQEGSLLLWAWLLALCAALALFLHRDKLRDLMPWATFILLLNTSFFLLLLNFVSHPFALFPGQIPPDGYGLNPLLQNPGMVIHPPTLFIGYVGLAVPYAFALASLLVGRSDSDWIKHTRIWTVVSWFFLGVGILLGAEWAYVELGWGGYWAWDPVENASLMPWLTATAFMHSIMIQQRRGMFKIWNMNLIIITYFLIIFGTFITRSGLISSVHAFGKSSLGTFFLVFMIVTLVLGLMAVWWRRKLLVTENSLESLLSRESAFLLTNLIFSAMAFSVFWGTTFPVLSEITKGVKITVGPGFYNRVNVPIALVLMVLMGVGPLLVWRRPTGARIARAFTLPVVFGVMGAFAAFASGIRNVSTILVMTFSALILGSVLVELYRGACAHRGTKGDPLPLAALKVVLGNRRRYGGYIVHLGIVLIFMGLAGAPLTREVTGTIIPNESISVGDYTLKYMNMRWVPTKDRLAVTTRLKVFHKGQALGYLVPERRFYENREDQPTSEVSILSNWKEDLYVALTGYNRDGRASFRILINPFVSWLWGGGYVVGFGVLLAVWPRRPRVLPGSREGGKP